MTQPPFFNPKVETLARDELRQLQIERLQSTLNRVYRNVTFYRNSFDTHCVNITQIADLHALQGLPFTTRADLRQAYPYDMFAVPLRDIVRIHSTSGTTGSPINRLHTHVHGILSVQAGTHTKGTPYKARTPELLLWVHATLIDTILYTYPLFLGPISQQEQEHYYQESKTLAGLLGLSPKDMPRTVKDLRQYVDDMVHSNTLAATPQARQLAQQVLFPPVPTPWRPLLHLNCQITCALLPQPIREIYGLEWSTTQQRAFDLSAWSMRAILPHLPMSLRVLPITRRMMECGELTYHMLWAKPEA